MSIMHEYLIDQAIQDIWCNPRQDNQVILKPQRVSPESGSIGQAHLLDRWVRLPWSDVRSHVFQVGQIPPALFGLLERSPSWRKEQWISFQDAMKELPLYSQIYTELGITVPRFNAYFMWTREKCLIFAIKIDQRIPVNLAKTNVYFRFYTSAYLKQIGTVGTNPMVDLVGYETVTQGNIAMIQSSYLNYSRRPGFTECFINGQYVDALTLKNMKVGDIVEWVYDATVKRTVSWVIKDLKSFTSTLDRKSKYILHYSKSAVSNIIDFQDDIDVYIRTKGAYDTKIGRYFVKNLPSSMRNLTHRDYSINADVVTSIANGIAEFLKTPAADTVEYEVFIKIKEGGYNRPLIQDSNRILDLYRLEDYRILMAMSGVESAVPQWHASTLEAAAYTNVMGSNLQNITIEKAEDAYGYNTIAKKLADSPLFSTSTTGQYSFDLGYLCSLGATVYEYDVNGRLQGHWYHDTRDDDYEARSPFTRSIETYVGDLKDRSPSYYGYNNIPIPNDCSWRLYRCRLDMGHVPPIPMNDWVDITDTQDYAVEDKKIVWKSPETDQYLCLRTDEWMLGYDLDVRITQGTIIFPLFEISDRGNGPERGNLDIPFGSLQLFMNGSNLVEGIDYVVNFPYVSINCYEFAKQPVMTEVQRIHVKMSGFCSQDLKFIPPTERGFVRNGLLSNDGEFHVYRDKITHITVGGSMKSQQQAPLIEEGANWNPRSPLNGRPYQIDKTITPLRSFTRADTYTLLEESRDISIMTDSYLDIHLPKPTDEPLSSSEARWRLVSPFFAHIIDLCDKGSLDWPDWQILSEQEVMEICKPFEGLLPYDPVIEENSTPRLYVNIFPVWNTQTTIVNVPQYRFLNQVVKLYGRGRISLNNFVKVQLV